MDIISEYNTNINNNSNKCVNKSANNNVNKCNYKEVYDSIPKCSYIKHNGERCKAIAAKENGLCTFHGGKHSSQQISLDGLDKGLAHIQTFISKVMVAVKNGKLAPNVGNSLANLAGKLIDIHKTLDLQEEIKRLQESMKNGRNNTGYNGIDGLE